MLPLRPAFWRAALMRKLGDLSTRDVPGIARTVTRDIGQVISQTGRQLVPRAADNFHYFAEMRTRTDGHTHPTPTHVNDTLFHPVGVCALISPWNLPFMTATWKAAPCLAFGKSAVLKLSELSPPPRSLRWLPPLGAQAHLGAARRGVMMPPRSLRSLPPLGVQAPLGAARRGVMMPPRSLRSLPPLGVQAPLGAARREA